MNDPKDYPNWHFIPQAPSSYDVHVTCQLENFGWLLEQLPKPFGIFNPKYKGRFVEVGAFDSVTYSNVYQFVNAGWKGIMIEPMKENFDKAVENQKGHEKIILENVACGEKRGTLEMFFEREGSRIAKTDEEKQNSRKVKVVTLNSILKKHQWKPDFDLFVSDTEDQELEVLAGFDLEYWKPKLAIVESHGHFRKQIHDIFDPLYSTYYEDGLNSLFTRRDWKP